MRYLLTVTTLAAALAMSPEEVHATNVDNGSFETGNFANWVTQDLASPFFPLRVGGAGLSPGFGFFVSAPTDGGFATLHGFDGSGPGTIRIGQDIAVTADGTIIEFDYRAAWDLVSFCSGCSDRIFDVNIEVAGGGANLDSFHILMATAGTIELDTGDVIGVVDLSAFVGQTVRLSFDFFVPENFTGPAFFQLDNVRVTGPPPCFVIDAIDDPFSVINDGTTTDFLVLANDECKSDIPIAVVELPGDLLPDRGGLATTDGATVGYTPAAGFVGFEEFTYTAQDAGLQGGVDPPTVDQDTAVIVVDVLEDIAPDAVDDVATTLQNQATLIDVLANDSLGNAPNGLGMETAPANGIATVEADNTIQYSPNLDFFGEDSFEYRLTDANGDSDVATVTVGVFFVGGQVPIDIIPDNLNLNAGQGAGIEVVILSVGEFFDAPTVIDPLSLKFGPRQGNIWGSPRVRDVDGDGDGDLLVKFLMQQSGIACGDTHATLTGRTFDFESISGTDTINTFNCPRVRKRH